VNPSSFYTLICFFSLNLDKKVFTDTSKSFLFLTLDLKIISTYNYREFQRTVIMIRLTIDMNFGTSDRWFYYKYSMLQRQTNVFSQAFLILKCILTLLIQPSYERWPFDDIVAVLIRLPNTYFHLKIRGK